MPTFDELLQIAVLRRRRQRRTASNLVLFEDAFNRADSATTLGSEYTVSGLTWGIQSNRAYCPSTSASGLATHDCDEADVDVTLDVMLRSVGDNSRGFLYLRGDGTTSNRWFVGMDNAFSVLRLGKSVAATSADVKTVAFTPTAGNLYTLRVLAKGSAFQVWVDGVEKTALAATGQTDNASLTYCGLMATRGTSATGSPIFDNLKVLRAA